MIVSAPAKINLHLAVMDRREDGLHNLESLFLALDLEDSLSFEEKKGDKSRFGLKIETCSFLPEGNKLDVPIEKNIVFKAFSVFKEKYHSKGYEGLSSNFFVKIDKRIPVGGGLGGGSSDAAATLLALNSMVPNPLSQTELLELASALGSDVPFFIYKTSAAWITGRGEIIKPAFVPPWHFVLVNPGFSSDTGEAYRLLDEAREKGEGRREKGEDTGQKSLSPVPTPYSRFYNDFLAVLPQKTTYTAIISQLSSLGAEYANLSGSGSTCFGVFSDKNQAEKAANFMKKEWGFVQSCSVKKFI